MKRNLMGLALFLFVGGMAMVLYSVAGPMVGADTTSLVGTEADTLKSLLTFGGAMVASAVVLFIALARLG